MALGQHRCTPGVPSFTPGVPSFTPGAPRQQSHPALEVGWWVVRFAGGGLKVP